MVDVKISGLPAADALTGNELLAGLQGTKSVKVLVSAIRAGMASDSSVVHTAGDESIGGVKTFTSRPVFNIGMRLPISQQLRFGDGVEADVGVITANSVGTMIVAGNAASGSGGLLLRPNNAASVTGQVALNADGSMVFGGLQAAKLATLSSLGAVNNSGAETIGGIKTFAARSVHTLGARIGVDQVLEMGGAGATFRGNGTGSLVIGSAGPSTGGLILLRPQGDQVATNQVTIYTNGAVDFSGDAASKTQTRTSLGAVGLAGAEQVSGVKTFSSEVRIQNVAPGFWLDESDGANGFFAVVDSGVMQLQVRGPNFGGYVRQMLQVSASGGTFAMGGDLVRPLADNAQALGASNYRFTSLWSVNGAVQTSDARLKTPLEHMTDVEEAAFLEIGTLPAKWKWKARVEEEGDAARWHAGPSVQAAIAVMERHGLNAFAYSAFCYDSWPAEDEVWREWPAQEAEVVEWPAVPETWADIPAEVDEAGEIVVPARRELVHEAMPAGRVVLKEAVEAGRELIQSAVEAGDRYSFRVSELQAWILAATARRDRREREAAELRLASIEQRLAVLESGK